MNERADKRLDDLSSVAEIEARRGAGIVRTRKRQRRKRAVIGLAVSIVIAGSTGVWIGLRSHKTAEELAAEQQARAEAQFNFKRESDRLINELWKMEDLERAGR